MIDNIPRALLEDNLRFGREKKFGRKLVECVLILFQLYTKMVIIHSVNTAPNSRIFKIHILDILMFSPLFLMNFIATF